jgi:hypothetical protein
VCTLITLMAEENAHFLIGLFAQRQTLQRPP